MIISQYDMDGTQTDFHLRRYARYAAVYAARKCIDRGDRSFAGFRSFVETFDYSTIGTEIASLGSQIISTAEQLISQGLPTAGSACPFVLPVTVDDALLSLHLGNTANPSNPFYEALVGIMERRMYKCFLDVIDDKEEIFLRCMWPGVFE